MRCPGRIPSGAASLVGGAMLLLAPRAGAQQYGQWSWTGEVAVGQRRYENEVDGGKQSYGEKNLRFSLGLNGYVLSPAIAAFRLSGDVLLMRLDGEGGRRTTQLGGRGDVSILPQGAVPVQLYAGMQRYDFGKEISSPIYSSDTPDLGTTAGGRLRVRRGLLSGLLAGYDWSRLSFVEAGSRPQSLGTGFVDWVAPVASFQPHVRVERRDEEFGRVGYSFRDWVGGYDHRGPLPGGFTWQLSATGLDRETSWDAGASTTARTARVQSNVLRPTGAIGTLSIDYGLGYGSYSGGTPSVTHAGTVRWVAGLGSGFTAGSAVTWSSATARDFSSDGPQVSLNGGWSGRSGPWSSSVGLGGDWLQQDQAYQGRRSRSSSWGGSASLSVAHESSSGLREELAVSAATHELKPAGVAETDLPDLGTGFLTARTEDRQTARLTLSAPLGGVRTVVWGEVERRDTSEGFQNPVDYRFERETLSGSVLAGRVSLVVNAGNTRLKNGIDQEVRFLGASLTLRPSTWLNLGGSYRLDRRHLTDSPNIDAWRAEALMGVVVGAFRLTGTGFLTEEKVADGTRRRNQGFTWSLSRTFGGWLPFVSAPVRRGVVR